ncbi:MAG: hypothetical protein IT317_20265 [Anaerolineales bacterium]|nr:hypothetical protein [Anaerolineales bacterium]
MAFSLSKRLHARRGPWLAALLAVTLALPALAAGRQLDDDLLFATLRASAPAAPTALNRLFALMGGDAAHAQAQMNSGFYPWWTLPTAQVAFWRPAAAFTHWLDFRLWPAVPALMHAHSLVYFALLVAAAAGLYRTVADQHPPAPASAALAALLYAVDDAHGFGAAWLANRNGLLAALFATLALIAHLRWRRDGWRPGVWLSIALLALALLSNEGAAAGLGYWLAAAVFLETGRWTNRLRALLPALAVIALWRTTYTALGYGQWGTTYVDPAREPLAFLSALARHGPVLLLGQWLLPPAEVAPFLTGAARLGLWLFAVTALVVLALWLWPVVARSATARFWGAGMLLAAALPAGGALPANRLLFIAGLGACGLLAEGLNAPPAPQAWRRVVRGTLLVVHLGLAPLLLPLTAFSPALLGGLAPAAAALPAGPELAAQTVIVVSAPSFAHATYLPLLREQHGLPAPTRVRGLATGLGAVTVTRADAATLTLTPADGFITGFDGVFRGPAHPLPVGALIDLGDLQVTILAQRSDGHPAAAAFRFAHALEDPGYVWVTWQARGYAPWTPPPIGATTTLPAQLSSTP